MPTHSWKTLQQQAREQLPAHEAARLAEHVSGRDRGWLFAHADDAVPAAMQANYRQLVARRAAGEPLAYIIGNCGFWTLNLEVTAATLIPRVETELLVEAALQRLPEHAALQIADLGTGSGALALALASERPQITVHATDISSAALAVAQANADAHRLHHVRFFAGDWLAPLHGHRYDLIVSNPPYIEAGDEHLDAGDLPWEPMTALVSGNDGLDAIRQITQTAPEYLHDGGWLLFEHGFDQAARVRDLLDAAGYDDIFTMRDLEQRERVTGARRYRSESA